MKGRTFALGSLMLVTACQSSCPNILPTPAAQPPIVETFYVQDGGAARVVAQNAGGDYDVLPADRFEVRLRIPSFTDTVLQMNGQQLTQVNDADPHPEHDSSGYYSFGQGVVIGTDIFPVTVVPPVTLRAGLTTHVAFEVINRSRDGSLPAAQREARTLLWLAPVVNGVPVVTKVEPGTVFDEGWNSKDRLGGLPFERHASQSIVARKVTAAGWLVPDFGPNNSGEYVENRTDRREDWLYTIALDPDFIERNYPAPGAFPLNGAVLRGNPSDRFPFLNPAGNDLPFVEPGARVAPGHFMLPLANGTLKVELNSWHISRRGPAPPGWVPDPEPAFAAENAWPFPPRLPYGAGEPDLALGEYVIVSGTLWQDSAHGHAEAACWNDYKFGHGGYLEIHPVDMVRRVRAPQVRKAVHVFSICGAQGAASKRATFSPDPAKRPHPSAKLRWSQSIDDRFSDTSTASWQVTETTNGKGSPALRVSATVGNGGRFKAVYVLWWE